MSFDSPCVSGSPRVSVILPTHNRASVLDRAVRSVFEQTFNDLELIIVDDGSEDETEALVGRIEDPRIVFKSHDANRGPAAARNTGIALARGEFLAFQDSDDEWLPQKLECHLEAFSTLGPDVAVTYSDMDRIDRGGSSRPQPAPVLIPGRLIDPDSGFYQSYGLGIVASVFRRGCFDGGLRFDEKLRCFEDLDLLIRMVDTHRFHHIAKALVRYHESEGISTNLRNHLHARRRLLSLYGPRLLRHHKGFFLKENLKVSKGLLALALSREED